MKIKPRDTVRDIIKLRVLWENSIHGVKKG